MSGHFQDCLAARSDEVAGIHVIDQARDLAAHVESHASAVHEHVAGASLIDEDTTRYGPSRGAGAAGSMAAGGSAGAVATGLAVAAAGACMVALTTFRQPADSLATFLCRQASASLPPGVTLRQCDMKSLRQ